MKVSFWQLVEVDITKKYLLGLANQSMDKVLLLLALNCDHTECQQTGVSLHANP